MFPGFTAGFTAGCVVGGAATVTFIVAVVFGAVDFVSRNDNDESEAA